MEPTKTMRVVEKSREPALPLLRPLKSGDLQELTLGMQSPDKVGCSTDEQIKRVLRRIMLKLGIRAHNLPSEDAKMLLLDHIRAKYADCTLEVIALAFDMAIVGKLEVESNCYENFSCQYFSSIMEAYRKWAKSEFKEIPALPPVEVVKENLSSFAMLRWLAQEIRFIKTGKPFEFVPLELYDYLEKRGMITATNEEKLVYLQKAASWRAGELAREVEKKNNVDNRNALAEFRRMQERGYFTGPEVERLKKLAKRLLFYDLIQKNY